VLTWDDANDEWIPAAPTGGSSGTVPASGVTVTRAATQAIDQNTNEPISFSAVVQEDASGYWDSGDPTKIVIQHTGWHVLAGTGKWAASTGGRRNLFIRKNGAGAETDYANFGLPGDSIYNDPHAGYATVEYLTAGDYIELCARQNNAATIDISLVRFSVTQLAGGPGAWTTYTPTWGASTTPPTLGSSTVSGRYKALDTKTYIVQVNASVTTGGAWNAGSGQYTFTLPAGLTAATRIQVGSAHVSDAGTAHFAGTCFVSSGGTTIGTTVVADSTGARTLSNTNPVTWATGDSINLSIMLEVQ
jgi:hypothetical protein